MLGHLLYVMTQKHTDDVSSEHPVPLAVHNEDHFFDSEPTSETFEDCYRKWRDGGRT